MLLAGLLALCLLRTGYSQTYPNSVLVPSNAITAVSFSCSATQLESWRVNGSVLTITTIPTGIVFSSPGGVPTITVAKESVLTFNGTAIQCRQAKENFSSVPTAFIIVYGPPSEPVDLSSESVSDGVLVFSWSPPWGPDGVQLNYTVTVTNTNTSSVVRNYATSNTSISFTRSNVKGDGECDQYVWSVTAVNPAGISGPANHTTTVSFIPVPGISQLSLCVSSDNFTKICFVPLNGFMYGVAPESMALCSNSCSEPSTVNGMVIFQVPVHLNHTEFTILAEHNCTEGTTRVNISDVTMTCPVVSPSHTVSTVVAVPSVPLPSESSLPPTGTTSPIGSVWIYIVVVVVILLLVILVVLGIALMYWRWRKRQKTHTCYGLPIAKSHLSENEKVLQVCEEEVHQQEKTVSTLASLLPEYATPADARKAKEVELVKQNETSKQSTLKSLHGKLPSGAKHDVPSVTTQTPKVMDTAMYSEVFQSQKQSHSSAPPPPPPPGPGDYASLQHDTGQPGTQVDTYDIPQDGDAPHLYSSVGQPPQALSKDKYSELQHMSSSGDRVHGTTNVVEYSVFGPKTGPPVLPPPPSDEVVKEMNM